MKTSALSYLCRFMSKVHIKHRSDQESCWEWQGAKNAKGYGTVRIERKTWLAHRFLYELLHGQTESCVLHSCDNPSCVNPDHLRSGNHKDNMQDMVTRGRLVVPRRHGEQSNFSRFTETEVIEMRRIRHSEGLSYAKIGAKFGTSGAVVHKIVRGKTWKHLPMQAD